MKLLNLYYKLAYERPVITENQNSKIKGIAKHVLDGFSINYELNLQEIPPDYIILTVSNLAKNLTTEDLKQITQKLEDVYCRNFNMTPTILNDFIAITLETTDGRIEGNFIR